MKRLVYTLLFCTALFGVQCNRRPLVDPGNTHYVRVYVDEELKNVTTGFYDPALPRPEYGSPEALKVILCDPASGHIVAERYLRNQGNDSRGHFYDGYIVADPGKYCLLTYNFGTESTLLRNEQLYHGAEAYTDEIPEHIHDRLSRAGNTDERIVYTPDHLFVDRCETVSIPYQNRIDTLRNAAGDYFSGSSIVKSYYLQIRVKGAQWISSAEALLTGMAGSTTLHDGCIQTNDPVTLYFDMACNDGTQRSNGEATLYATFSTFGKLPEQTNRLDLTFDIITTDGRALTATLDITDEFSELDAVQHQWLLLDEVLDIPEPDTPEDGGGGFTPGIGDWEDIDTDIII